jgi:hypothetical protein
MVTNFDVISKKSCEKENMQKEGTYSFIFLMILNSRLKLRKAFSGNVVSS